jgi:hypothetical protein
MFLLDTITDKLDIEMTVDNEFETLLTPNELKITTKIEVWCSDFSDPIDKDFTIYMFFKKGQRKAFKAKLTLDP